MKRLALVLLAAACGTADSPHLDGRVVDSPLTIDAPELVDAPIDALTPYRKTITIDGVDDFALADRFATTSTGYDARIAWDDSYVYIGYAGADLAPSAVDAATKWLFAYVDIDPGAATGATQSQLYNTQRATFPSGFGAEYYARRKCDASLASIEQHASGAWTTVGTAPSAAQAGTFVELAIPRSVLGTSTQIGVVTWMINEKNLVESSYAGLYPANFIDGYAANLVVTKYLRIDFDSPRSPNNPANQAP